MKKYIKENSLKDIFIYQVKNLVGKFGSNSFIGLIIGILLVSIYIFSYFKNKKLPDIIFWSGYWLIIATLKIEDLLEIIRNKRSKK